MKSFSTFLFTALLVLVINSNSLAQSDFNVPKNLELKVAEDYARLEPSIVNAAKWLEETDLNKNIGKRSQVEAFVVQWVSGSPTVEIIIDEVLMKLVKGNEPFLSLYMASYSSFMIQNKGANKKQAIKAAITSLINVYKKDISINKNKELQKLSRMESSELEKYIAEKME